MPLDDKKQNNRQPESHDEDALLEQILAEARAMRARKEIEQLPDEALPEKPAEQARPEQPPSEERLLEPLSGKDIAAAIEREIQEFVPPSETAKQTEASEGGEPARSHSLRGREEPPEDQPMEEPSQEKPAPKEKKASLPGPTGTQYVVEQARQSLQQAPQQTPETPPAAEKERLFGNVKKRLRRKEQSETPDPVMMKYGNLRLDAVRQEPEPGQASAPDREEPTQEPPIEAEEFVTIFQKIQKNRKPMEEKQQNTRQLERTGRKKSAPSHDAGGDTIRFTGLRDLKRRQQERTAEDNTAPAKLPVEEPKGPEPKQQAVTPPPKAQGQAAAQPDDSHGATLKNRSETQAKQKVIIDPAADREAILTQTNDAVARQALEPVESVQKPPVSGVEHAASALEPELEAILAGLSQQAKAEDGETSSPTEEPFAQDSPSLKEDKPAEEEPEFLVRKTKPTGKSAKGSPTAGQDKEPPQKLADTNTIEWDIFAPAQSKYEQHFGKLRPAKVGQTADQGAVERQEAPAKRSHSRERHNAQPAMELYRLGSRRLSLLVQGEQADKVLRAECKAYAGPTGPAQPERKKKEPAPKKEPPKQTLIGDAPETPKGRFHIFGDAERDADPDELYQAEPEEIIDDYTGPEDAFSVKKEINSNVRRMFLRSLLMGVLLFFILALTVLQRINVPAIQELFVSPYVYTGLSAGLLALSLLCCHTPIISGLSALVRLRGNSDSGIAFASVATLAGAVASFFNPALYHSGSVNLYAPLVIIGLFLNSWGKFIMVRRVQLNFKFIASPDQKYAAKILNDPELSQKICKGMGNDLPLIAYQKKAGFLTNFLQLSYEPDPSERMAGKLAPFGALLSLLAGGGSYLLTRDAHAALATLAVCACVSVPVCCVPAVNLPIRRLCKLAQKKGAMLVGYPGVRQFADTNVVELDVRQLYPKGNVTMHGIKTFSGQRIDEAILEAAAVICKVNGPMTGTFDQIIQGKSNLLPKVESVAYEDDMGLLSWVNGRRVLLGNRRLLEEHGVTPPTRDYESKFTEDGHQVTYLAAAGELMAMFVTSYRPDEEMVEEMQRLEDNGVSFVIRTCDPNLTAKRISEQCGVFFRSVKLLPERLGAVFDEKEEEPPHATRAYLATRGPVSAMQRLVAGCIRIRSNITLSIVLQMIAVVFGFVLVAFLALYAGVDQLGTLEMVIYTLFWVLAVMIVPSFRRP